MYVAREILKFTLFFEQTSYIAYMLLITNDKTNISSIKKTVFWF